MTTDSTNPGITTKRPALFLDRDGVLNVDHSYVFKIEDMELMPGVVEGLTKAAKAGFRLVIVTNQGGIALDYYTEAQMHAFNEELSARILAQSSGAAVIDGAYFCPHHPRSEDPMMSIDCDCRKPAPGMINQALGDFPDIDPKQSWMIGDKAADIDCGRAAGLSGAVQILGNYPAHQSPDAAFEHVGQAIDYILSQTR